MTRSTAGQERLVDLARGEGGEEGVEALERHRAAAAGGGTCAERAVPSLESGSDDRRSQAPRFVRLGRGRHRGLLRVGENEEAPLRRLGEGGFVDALRLPS